jgi:hypothetical protein
MMDDSHVTASSLNPLSHMDDEALPPIGGMHSMADDPGHSSVTDSGLSIGIMGPGAMGEQHSGLGSEDRLRNGDMDYMKKVPEAVTVVGSSEGPQAVAHAQGRLPSRKRAAPPPQVWDAESASRLSAFDRQLALGGSISASDENSVLVLLDAGADPLEQGNSRTTLHLALAGENPSQGVLKLLLKRLTVAKGVEWVKFHLLSGSYKQKELQSLSRCLGGQLYARGRRFTNKELVESIFIRIEEEDAAAAAAASVPVSMPESAEMVPMRSLLDSSGIMATTTVDTVTDTVGEHHHGSLGHSGIGEMEVDELLPMGKATPLHEAASRGDVGMVIHLIDTGAYPDAVDENGKSALHIAIEQPSRDCMSAMLSTLVHKYGAQPIMDLISRPNITRKDLSSMVNHVGKPTAVDGLELSNDQLCAIILHDTAGVDPRTLNIYVPPPLAQVEDAHAAAEAAAAAQAEAESHAHAEAHAQVQAEALARAQAAAQAQAEVPLQMHGLAPTSASPTGVATEVAPGAAEIVHGDSSSSAPSAVAHSTLPTYDAAVTSQGPPHAGLSFPVAEAPVAGAVSVVGMAGTEEEMGMGTPHGAGTLPAAAESSATPTPEAPVPTPHIPTVSNLLMTGPKAEMEALHLDGLEGPERSLRAAIAEQNVGEVSAALDAGADPRELNKHRKTAIHACSGVANAQILKLVLKGMIDRYGEETTIKHMLDSCGYKQHQLQHMARTLGRRFRVGGRGRRLNSSELVDTVLSAARNRKERDYRDEKQGGPSAKKARIVHGDGDPIPCRLSDAQEEVCRLREEVTQLKMKLRVDDGSGSMEPQEGVSHPPLPSTSADGSIVA